MKKVLVMMAMIAIAGCQKNIPSVVGDWVQPIPGQAGVQGMSLKKGGEASSIGMKTLLYQNWQQNEDNLILNGRSLGNGVESSFSDTLAIQKLTRDTLILKRGMLDLIYTRDGK